MEVSARSYLTAGISLTAATAIAFTPLVIPAVHQTVSIPKVTASDIQLAVSPADIEAFVAGIQGALDDATTTAAGVAGRPGQTLIGVVDNIVLTIDNLFSGLVNATGNPTLGAVLSILGTTSVDAFAKLAENLSLINPVITTTTAQAGELLTTALTGSLQNVLTAVVNVLNDPLSFANYAGLLNAGVASGQLLVGNGLETIHTLGDGAFDILGIALSEVTFQFNNLADGLGTILTELGDASGSALIDGVLGLVRGLTIAPAVALFNLGSGTIGTVLDTANFGFDLLLGAPTDLVESTGSALQSAITAVGAGPLDPGSYLSALGALTVGGFDGVDTTTETLGGLTQLPLVLGAGLNTTAATVLTSLNTAIATAVSGVAGAVGLPADVAALPVAAATGANGTITDAAAAVDDGLSSATGVIDDGVDVAHSVSADTDAEDAAPEAPSTDELSTEKLSTENSDTESGEVAPVAHGTEESDENDSLNAKTLQDNNTKDTESTKADSSLKANTAGDESSDSTVQDNRAHDNAAAPDRAPADKTDNDKSSSGGQGESGDGGEKSSE